ncbi:MAG: hypothetical protein H0U74_03660 [Bradymonadaceae bacterium]|nr:hypothetical protein [Lujinxingiaceae bacterium]
MFRNQRTHTALLLLATLLGAGCNRSPAPELTVEPWAHTGAQAPYALTVPGYWKSEDPKALNTYADFAASLDETLYLIAIPQKLPTFPIPDARAVKSASMEMMQEAVAEISIERQGDVMLDDVLGVTVFFKGTVAGERIQYITTYITQAGWGYQIIAWGPAELERRLIEQIDAVLNGWKFSTRDPVASPPIKVPDEITEEISAEQQALDALQLEGFPTLPEETDQLDSDEQVDEENVGQEESLN